MTSRPGLPAAGNIAPDVSTSWLASILVGASLLELSILRIGTRTAIHVPGLERVEGPYRVFAGAGRLAFFVAVVLLAVLLPYLARDLFQRGRARVAAALLSFIVVAGLGALGVVDSEIMASAVVAIVGSLTVLVLAHQRREVRVVVGLFIAAFLLGALHTLVQGGPSSWMNNELRQLLGVAELMAVLAALASGPLLRRSLGLNWVPHGRVAWASMSIGVIVTGAIIASPSTAHILMLWNFGLSGGLPAPVYGLAVASLVVAVASTFSRRQPVMAFALTLFVLGGIGLTSTYQSGLIVAGLGLLDLSANTRGIVSTPTDCDARGHEVVTADP